MSNKLNVHRFFVMSQALICLDFVYPQFGRNDFRTVVLFEIDAIAQGTAILDFDFQESGLCRFKFDRVGNAILPVSGQSCFNTFSAI